MRKILTVFLAILCIGGLFASPISQQKAESLAKTFLQKQLQGKSIKLRSLQVKSLRGNHKVPNIYLFNSEAGDAFAIVSADDNTTPILAYSKNSSIDINNISPALKVWLEATEAYVESCKKSKEPSLQMQNTGTPIVAPMMDTILWGQGEPYNNLCPTFVEAGQTKHYYVGCVATAMAQIMKFHAYPTQGTGSKTYTDAESGNTLTANFGTTTYNWSNMLNSYKDIEYTEQQAREVATLSAHLGIAVEMTYMANGSGAWSSLVPQALKQYFGYDSSITYRKRDYYETNEWMQIIKDELQAGRPVFYSATSDKGSGGHAFVCDGYDSEDFVHINWGWYGESNGWFQINHLDPIRLGEGGGAGGYNLDQEIVTGIQRPTSTPTQYERPLYSAINIRPADFTSDFDMGGAIENFDMTDFTGDLAVVLTRNDSIIDILMDTTHQISAYADGRAGSFIFYFRRISKQAPNATDGSAKIKLAFRENSGNGEWQIMRYCRNYTGEIDCSVANNTVTINGANAPHPDVEMLSKLSPTADMFAKGSGIFPITLKNNSRDYRLKNVVIRFTSTQDTTQKYDYENPLHVYDQSTEHFEFLVNLQASMPQGEYRLTAFEKNFEQYPFSETEVSVITVLPAATRPVMRLTQAPIWNNNQLEQNIKQGEFIQIGIECRNYGVAGTARAIVMLTDIADTTRQYIFQESSKNVGQGESVVFSFGKTMPCDSGQYRINVGYMMNDGSIIRDDYDSMFNTIITVGDNPTLNLLRVDQISFPDSLKSNEKVTVSIKLTAIDKFIGTFYLRARQYTNTNGEIVTMKSLNLNAGDSTTISINYRTTLADGRYMLLAETKKGTTMGVPTNYDNYYKLFTVGELPTSTTESKIEEDIKIHIRDGKIEVLGNPTTEINRIDLFSINGMLIGGSRGYSIEKPNEHGIYIIRVETSSDSLSRKIVL